VGHQVEPLRTEIIDRSLGDVTAAVEGEQAAQSGIAHRGEIGIDPLPRDVAVHPEIQRLRPRLRRRRTEINRVGQRRCFVGERRASAERGQRDAARKCDETTGLHIPSPFFFTIALRGTVG
jgi:hypothetical protein